MTKTDSRPPQSKIYSIHHRHSSVDVDTPASAGGERERAEGRLGRLSRQKLEICCQLEIYHTAWHTELNLTHLEGKADFLQLFLPHTQK